MAVLYQGHAEMFWIYSDSGFPLAACVPAFVSMQQWHLNTRTEQQQQSHSSSSAACN